MSSASDVASAIEAGQVAERAGQPADARAHYETALHALRVSDSPEQVATLFRWIARTYMNEADFAAALDCAEAALAVSAATGDFAGEGHAVNMKAAIQWTRGDLDAADELFRQARSNALVGGDRALVAMTSANLGMIASVRGDFPDALHHYSVGLTNYRDLDRPRDVCNALNNMGLLYTDMGQWHEAEGAYAEAVDIATALEDNSTQIILDVNRAKMWIAMGDSSRAKVAVDQAAARSKKSGDAAWVAEISKIRGTLLRDSGALEEAEQRLSEAVAIAEARQETLLLAETLRERAELYRGQGRNKDALQNLNRAHRLFTQLKAKRELANIGRSFTRLEDDFINVVKRWGESIEAKDRYTQGHCVRVADLACAIASNCGFEGQTLFWFRIGALLHDVGKLVIPSEVLNKAGKLDADEWELMRSHPSAGIDVLAGIDFPWDIRPIVESHHERWDGKGYPHAIAGETIPLSARILAVADVYDALTSVRSYKRAFSHDEAFAIMKGDVGLMFDPVVFEQFERVMAERQLPDGSEVKLTPPTGLALRTEMETVAAVDDVTGMPMRDAMERIGAQIFADRRMTHESVSLLVIEVDIEPSRGQAGEANSDSSVLRGVAQQLRHETRPTDFVARTGARQFMALFPSSTATHATAVMRRLRAAFDYTIEPRTTRTAIATIRIAVVTASDEVENFEQLAIVAERAVAEHAAAQHVASTDIIGKAS